MKLLKLVPDNTNIDFVGVRNIALILSILVTIASLALVVDSVRISVSEAPSLVPAR